MKRVWVLLIAAIMLGGCAATEYEGVRDVFEEQPLPVAGEMKVLLPVDASVVTMEHDTQGKIWMCKDYSVCIQTLPSGDLDATLRTVSGFGAEEMEMMERQGPQDRYDCIWVSAGEGGDQLNRAVILDDGSYHYVLSLHGPAEMAAELSPQWQNIASSVTLNTAP